MATAGFWAVLSAYCCWNDFGSFLRCRVSIASFNPSNWPYIKWFQWKERRFKILHRRNILYYWNIYFIPPKVSNKVAVEVSRSGYKKCLYVVGGTARQIRQYMPRMSPEWQKSALYLLFCTCKVLSSWLLRKVDRIRILSPHFLQSYLAGQSLDHGSCRNFKFGLWPHVEPRSVDMKQLEIVSSSRQSVQRPYAAISNPIGAVRCCCTFCRVDVLSIPFYN